MEGLETSGRVSPLSLRRLPQKLQVQRLVGAEGAEVGKVRTRQAGFVGRIGHRTAVRLVESRREHGAQTGHLLKQVRYFPALRIDGGAPTRRAQARLKPPSQQVNQDDYFPSNSVSFCSNTA